MSAHFSVLREADLIDSTKQGTSIVYRLKLSVLEDSLLGFAHLFGIKSQSPRQRLEVEAEAPSNEDER